MLISSVQRVKHSACGSGSRSWVALGASGEVCEFCGHQAAYVTGCSVGQHLFGIVDSAFGAPSVPSNYGPATGSVDCVNYLFYGFSDGRLLFFEVVAFMGRHVQRRVEEQVGELPRAKVSKACGAIVGCVPVCDVVHGDVALEHDCPESWCLSVASLAADVLPVAHAVIAANSLVSAFHHDRGNCIYFFEM